MGKSYLKHKEVPPDLSKAWGQIRTVIRESSISWKGRLSATKGRAYFDQELDAEADDQIGSLQQPQLQKPTSRKSESQE